MGTSSKDVSKRSNGSTLCAALAVRGRNRFGSALFPYCSAGAEPLGTGQAREYGARLRRAHLRHATP
jgi:hypothetical protein